MYNFFKKTDRIKRKNIYLTGILCFSFLFLAIYSSLESARLNRKLQSFRNLEKKVNQEFKGLDMNFSFLVKDLRFPELEFSYQAEEQFPAASLIKLPILAVIFKAVEENKISLADKVTVRKMDVFGGSGKLKKMDLPYTLDIKELLSLMISMSDNTATNKLIGVLGFKYINAKFKEMGFKNTLLTRRMMDFKKRRQGRENYTSSRDIALILEKIYNENLVSKDLSRVALSFLLKQKVNDRIPLYLPEGILIAHKTGLEKGVVHDAGIVFAPKSDYVICILVKDAKSFKQVKKIIAQVSLLTYNLYQ